MRVWMRWALLFAAVAARSVAAGELSGEAGIEMRLFPHDGLDNRQHASNLSLSLEPEFYHDWRDGDERFVVVPYFRLDQGDPARRHFDLRELYWRRSFATADLYMASARCSGESPSRYTWSTSSTRRTWWKIRTPRTNWANRWSS